MVVFKFPENDLKVDFFGAKKGVHVRHVVEQSGMFSNLITW